MYTISQAAERAGVTADLLRAWERRYRIVAPRRTASGYRLYDEDAIARVRAMRALVGDGWTPSAAADHLRAVADADLGDVVERTGHPTPADEDDLTTRFVDAAARMDDRGVQAVLDEIGARGSFEAAVERWLFPALRALGEGWARGDVSVAAEHAASAAVGRWLGRAFEAAGPPAPDVGAVLVGLPPRARHELGALAFATAARRSGLAVRYLGADLPVDDWVAAARTARAAGAVVAVPTAEDVRAAGQVRAALRRAMPALPILFGGGASRRVPRANLLPDDLAAAVDALRASLSGAESPARQARTDSRGSRR